IRDNLAAASKQFRKRTKDVNIWGDALCINQVDLDKKRVQLSRMGQIFSEATFVSVCLGAGEPETKETFDFLKCIKDLKVQDCHETGSLGLESKVEWLLIRGF
ncbi:uncharacterized protein K444DRAFT_533000, partial [Hyaloscypha bicolor E]